MSHVLVCKHSVVLGSDIIGQVVIENQPKQTIEEGQIDLLIDLREHRLHQNIAFAVICLPNISQVVNSLTPLVNQERWGLGIRGLDPRREQPSFIRFKVQELIEILRKPVSEVCIK